MFTHTCNCSKRRRPVSNKISIILFVLSVFAQQVWPQDIAVEQGPRSITVGDFNNDGKQDLAIANFFSNNVTILLNGSPAISQPIPTIFTREITQETGETRRWTGIEHKGTAYDINLVVPPGTPELNGRPLSQITHNDFKVFAAVAGERIDDIGLEFRLAIAGQNLAKWEQMTDRLLPTYDDAMYGHETRDPEQRVDREGNTYTTVTPIYYSEDSLEDIIYDRWWAEMSFSHGLDTPKKRRDITQNYFFKCSCKN